MYKPVLLEWVIYSIMIAFGAWIFEIKWLMIMFICISISATLMALFDMWLYAKDSVIDEVDPIIHPENINDDKHD